MTLYIHDAPEAVLSLRDEGADVRTAGGEGALRVALLNLMPDKRTTERQVARLLARGDVDVRLRLFVPPGHRPRGESPAYLARHYTRWEAIASDGVDALMVTGTPQERRPFESVSYWPELQRVFAWSRRCVASSWFSCWGAMAALHYDHGVPKQVTREKVFGLYAQTLERGHPITRGLGDRYLVPVSRHACVPRRWIDCNSALQVLASSPSAGAGLVAERGMHRVYMLDHPEYEAETLLKEYARDREAGLNPAAPRGYDVGDDAVLPPAHWRHTGTRMLNNWLHEVLRMRAARDATRRACPAQRTAAQAGERSEGCQRSSPASNDVWRNTAAPVTLLDRSKSLTM